LVEERLIERIQYLKQQLKVTEKTRKQRSDDVITIT
jgi:hypothetical protein